MSNDKQALKAVDAVKARVKTLLPQYLTSLGIQVQRQFQCINPAHRDKHPSCGLIKQTDYQLFHCFSCLSTGDIFDACSLIEGRPLAGRGFLTENLFYLAKRLGVDVPALPDMTEEEVREMDTYSAYLHASLILRRSKMSDRVKAALANKGWDETLTQKLAIGGVESYAKYWQRMTEEYKHDADFLRSVDLANDRLFNENALIFTIRDADGNPVAFASRDLLYEQKQTKYDQDVAGIKAQGLDPETEKDALDKLFKPRKFINTSNENPIYRKRETLYNLDQARHLTPPMWVMEGQGDVATCVAGGLENSVGVCSTSFTKEHLQLILGLRVKHVIFVLDGDEAGRKGTRRIVELLQEVMPGYIGLKVELVTIPEGLKDPDFFVRSQGSLTRGVEALRKLPRTDLFSWKLKLSLEQGADPDTLARETIPLIVNEPHNLQRLQMAKRLADVTGLDEGMVVREIKRQIDMDLAAAEEEKLQILQKLAKDLGKNPAKGAQLLEDARLRLEAVEKRKCSYDVQVMMKHIDMLFERAESVDRSTRVRTGFHRFDTLVGGLLPYECLTTVPGKPNQGKSSLLTHLCGAIPEVNRDTIVFLHTIDDSMWAACARIIGAHTGYPSDYWKEPQEFKNKVPNFEKIYHQGKSWLLEMMQEEKLIVADVTDLPGVIPNVELWVRAIRNRFPSKTLVCMFDNFSLYDLPGFDPGEQKVREMSKAFKRMTSVYQMTALMTCELPKEALRPGIRPRMGKIKGTSGMAYDANLNLGVYNDLKDFGEQATICYDGPMESVIGEGGVVTNAPRKLPVIELVVDKSKICSYDGSIYYRFEPDSGRLLECSDNEQAVYRSRASRFHSRSGGQGELAASQAEHRAVW